MYRGPRPPRGAYPPAASRGFAPRGPPPANSFPSAPYRHEHARGSNGYPHGYRRHPEHPRRRYSSPGRGSAEDFRGDGPPPRDYGHRYTPSPPHGRLPTDHSLVITVGNELTGLSQKTGAEIPYARYNSTHWSSYEGHNDHSSRQHSPSHCRNRDWDHSPDRIHNRSHLCSRSHSRAVSHSKVLDQGCNGPRSRSRSRTRSRGRSRVRSKSRSHSRSRSRGRSQSHSGSSSCSNSSRNKRHKEDFSELEMARQRKELGDMMMMMPTKSILKKRVDSFETNSTTIGQKDLTSAGQFAHFPLSKQPNDDHSTFPNPSGPSDTGFKKPCNPQSLLTVDLFKKLFNKASTSSCPSNNKAVGQQSKETKNQSYSTLPSQFFHQDREQASTNEGSSTQSSASTQKSNLATQMERFLGALNKADSNLLSSMLRDARKDSKAVERQRISQEKAGREVSGGELCIPFREIDCIEDNHHLIGIKQNINPIKGQIENIQDDLLPHERAVVDGSGFSKIVGMKYGIEAKPENRFPCGESVPFCSQSRLLEDHTNFLKECDSFKLSREEYSDEPHFEDLYAEDQERYKKPSERHRVRGGLSPVHQKSEDANEDVDQQASNYKTIQALLQTVGLNLDTTEVSKLADRTKERLYGKKVKPQRSKQSISRYGQRDRSHSTDSEGVKSVSPAKTSNREVYMSYSDSLKYRHDEVSAEEQDLLNLKRTLRNSPKAKQVTSDPYEVAPPVTHDSYNPVAETLSLAQSVGFQHNQISSEFSATAHHLINRQDSQECSYATDIEQNPYGSFYLNPLHYAPGYPPPPPHLPPGYDKYTASARPLSMMPPNPAQFYPSLSTFTTPGSFNPSPNPPYPPTLGQFGFTIQPGSSGYVNQQTKTKPTAQNRCLKTIETIQTQKSVSVKLSAAKGVHTIISAQTKTEPKDTEGKAECQTAPMMEDDVKAKQKKRLEQFNQRMRLKKEQQTEAQRTRGVSQKSAPGKVVRTEVKNVWICGHSLVFWAEKRATSPEIGMQLGMDPNSVRIWWKGVQGMTWQQLLPQLLQLKDNWPKPDMILMHLGGNDIGKMTPETFVLAVKKDLISLKSIFPQCCLVWSDILPRKSWRHSNDSTAVNNMRQEINKTVHDIMAELGGSSLTHDNIVPRLDSSLYRPDGVHLSGKGIDTFNLNMQDFLEKWEREISETETSEG